MRKLVQVRCLECWSMWIGELMRLVKPRVEAHQAATGHVGYGVAVRHVIEGVT